MLIGFFCFTFYNIIIIVYYSDSASQFSIQHCNLIFLFNTALNENEFKYVKGMWTEFN